MALEYFELIKDVFVFKDVLKDPKHTYDIIKKSQIEPHELFTEWGESEFPWAKSTMDMDEQRDLNNEPGKMILEIKSIFNECFKIYKENHLDLQYLKSLEIEPKFNIPTSDKERGPSGGWGPADILIVDYGDRKLEGGYINGYHIDRTPYWGASPHAYTLNIYPNDNFDGGGLFFVDMESAEKKYTESGVEYYLINEPTYYEPKAGEALLFKATHPHGVNEVTNGEKLFIRLFMESPRSNQYFEDIKTMTQEEIDQKTIESRNDCIRNHRQQAGIYSDIQSIDSNKDESLKFMVRA